MTKELLGETPATAFPFFFPPLPLSRNVRPPVMYQTATLHLVTYLSAFPSNLSRPGLRPDLRYFSLPPVFLYTHDIPRMYGLP